MCILMWMAYVIYVELCVPVCADRISEFYRRECLYNLADVTTVFSCVAVLLINFVSIIFVAMHNTLRSIVCAARFFLQLFFDFLVDFMSGLSLSILNHCHHSYRFATLSHETRFVTCNALCR